MPPPKGQLSASMAILSLFVSEPSTAKNITSRLRREFPNDAWSPSIVNTTIPNLVEQGVIVRVREGRKPSEHFYEATDEGISECRRELAKSSRAVPQLRDPFLVWFAHSTEDELDRLLTVAREREETAIKQIETARLRLNIERDIGNLGPADGSDWSGWARYTVLNYRIKALNYEARLAKSLRLSLTQGHDLHELEDLDE
jgi:DNA-binding PadR family transcriptional regulator